jgi:hypothetical protein
VWRVVLCRVVLTAACLCRSPSLRHRRYSSGWDEEVVLPPHFESFRQRGVGIIAELQSLDSADAFVVATTHLFWNPAQELVKEAQVEALLVPSRV